MRIVQVNPGTGISIPPLNWGAVEKIVWELIQNFKKLGHTVDLKWRVEVKKGDYDLVIVHVANLALELADEGIPYVFYHHDHHAYYYGKSSETYLMNREAMKRSIFSIVPAKYLVEYFDLPNVHYFSHGVNTDEFYPIDKPKPTYPKLLMVANNGIYGNPSFDRKGFGYGIALAQMYNLPITIAGPSTNKNYFNENLWTFSYPKLNIVFDLPNSELLNLYHTHDIFLNPTMLEAGHPNLTMLEAAASGLPIIGNWEIETDFHGAWRANRDVFAMANGLNDILNNWHDYRSRCKTTSTELSWKNRTIELLKLFNKYSDNDININYFDTTIDKSKEVFVVSTYPVSNSIIRDTIRCIESIKSTGRKVILTSHIPIPAELVEVSDYVINDNNNILTKHTYYNRATFNTPQYIANIYLNGEDNDVYHGPSCYTNYYNGADLAQKLGYDKVYFINYDYLVKSEEYINNVSSILNKYSAYFVKNHASEGDRILTWFMACRPDLILSIPKISSAIEYDSLMNLWGAESNGYENLMYHAFKNNNGIYWETEESFNILTNSTFEHLDYSQVEYYTVLPTNSENELISFFRISNVVDSRYVLYSLIKNGVVEINERYDITESYTFVHPFNYSDGDIIEINFDIFDSLTNNQIKSKKILIDKNYIMYKIKNNGIFEWIEN
jgi:glycosyltransferase involved in cell wall biosynthesis